MSIEHKAIPFEVKAVGGADEGHWFAGHGAVFHNIDRQQDIIAPGAFAPGLAAFLADGFIGGLNHNWDQPIAVPVEASEDAKGLYLKTGPILETAHGRDVIQWLTSRPRPVVRKLSIGYAPMPGGETWLDGYDEVKAYWDQHGYTPSVEDIERAQQPVRLLTKLFTYEVSPVARSANNLAEITSAKADAVTAEDFEDHSRLVVSAVGRFLGRVADRHEARIKVGRVLSRNNRDEIEAVAAAMESGSARLRDLLAKTAPEPEPGDGKAAPQPIPNQPTEDELVAAAERLHRARMALLPALAR